MKLSAVNNRCNSEHFFLVHNDSCSELDKQDVAIFTLKTNLMKKIKLLGYTNIQFLTSCSFSS